MEDIYVIGPDFTLVSGGQTGADQAGLGWAIANGIKHGGWCRRGRKSEDVPIAASYRLTEKPAAACLQRTEGNVRDSDAPLVFTLSDQLDGGSKRTVQFAGRSANRGCACAPACIRDTWRAFWRGTGPWWSISPANGNRARPGSARWSRTLYHARCGCGPPGARQASSACPACRIMTIASTRRVNSTAGSHPAFPAAK